MKRSSLVAIIVVALAVVGAVIYLARPRPEEFAVATPAATPGATQPVSSTSAAPALSSALTSCIGPTGNAQSQIAALDTQHQYAHSLVEKNHYETALPALRNIAVRDPGYPGINLEISETLLKSRHVPEANDAVNVQLEISQCLAKLPDADAQAYCKSQGIAEAGCSAELAKIETAATHQAGLVKVELAKSSAPNVIARTTPPAARTSSAPARAATSAPVSEPVAAPPPPPKPVPMLKADEASAHVGERATVCGTAVSKTTSQGNGKPTFINLDHPFPN